MKVQTFGADLLRLLQASPIFGGSVVLAAVVLGFGPALWWQFFARFIDAAYSARGVGTVTSDLTHALVWLAVLGALLIISFAWITQVRAKSRLLAVILIAWLIGITHVLVLAPITKSFLFFLLVLAVALSVLHGRIVRIATFAVVFLLAISTVTDLLFMMTRRSFSVGSMIEYSATALTLCALVVVLHTPRLRAIVCAL